MSRPLQTGRCGGQLHAAKGFTVVELLAVTAILSLLLAILLPALSQARKQAKAVRCAANLRSVGELIHSFANAHDDYVASVIAKRDSSWDEPNDLGWDIETGRWANVLGGPKSIWQCGRSAIAFVGNARALGLDNRMSIPGGLHHRVGLRHWFEPGRLVLAYDLQVNLTENLYAHALDPLAADLSDEGTVPWARDSARPLQPFNRDRFGPHDDKYGVLFADAHARVDQFGTREEAVFWSGPRWWGENRSSPAARRTEQTSR